MSKICEWTEDEDGCWNTDCGGKFEVLNGTPQQNGMNYCHYCGKKLKEVPYVEPAVDEEET